MHGVLKQKVTMRRLSAKQNRLK